MHTIKNCVFGRLQVHEHDDLSNDYSNKKHVMSVSTTVSKPQLQQQQQQQQLQLQQQQQLQQQLHKYRKAVAKSNRAKHGRKLTSRQDLKNLLVMRPPPMGQSQTWRYVYNHPATMARHHQYYQRKPPMAAAAAAAPPLMPAVLKTRTVPLILHIRQRSDNWRVPHDVTLSVRALRLNKHCVRVFQRVFLLLCRVHDISSYGRLFSIHTTVYAVKSYFARPRPSRRAKASQHYAIGCPESASFLPIDKPFALRVTNVAERTS